MKCFDRSLLSSLFPIPITWNFATPPKKCEEIPNLESSIAVRLAYSVFQAHKVKSTNFKDLQDSFSNFRLEWDKTTAKPEELVKNVLQRIQNWLPKGRRILVIADEASKTGVPKEVRETLYNAWIRADKNSRLIMSSLHPGETGCIKSGPKERWVQLTRGNPDVVQTMCDSYGWLKKLEPAERSKVKAIVRYLLNMCGNNWRARCEVHEIVKEGLRRAELCSLNSGVTLIINTTIEYFLDKTDVDWFEAVNDFLSYTVLRKEVVLVSRVLSSDETEFGQRKNTAASWLLKGLLSNPIPIVTSTIPKLADVPELPMVLIHNWLNSSISSLTPKAKRDYIQISPFVQQMITEAQLYFTVPVAKAWERFENVMAYFFGLVLHCSHALKRNLRLFSESTDSDCTVLFPAYQMNPPGKDITLNHPRVFRPCDMRVLKLEHKISGPKALDNSISCEGNDAVFICAKTEDAIDLILYVDTRLVVLQSKFYFDTCVTRPALNKMLRQLTDFRGKLWRTSPGDEHPVLAKKLGLASIEEKDVVFVLLATAGLTVEKAEDNDVVKAKSSAAHSGLYNTFAYTLCHILRTIKSKPHTHTHTHIQQTYPAFDAVSI